MDTSLGRRGDGYRLLHRGRQLRDPPDDGEVPAFSILQPGDMIVSVNGIALKGPPSRRTIQSADHPRDPATRCTW